ncbi:hypothetical protein [Methylocaldum sp. RMAD-M]|uniref:hypothetical protein n=1 Tax=Methylocaldum sp. RMAD-M TaxID=2806557 RepID=UPI000A321230|nr:hypothetical protein [Methylocaldum sp. RMAD-M]
MFNSLEQRQQSSWRDIATLLGHGSPAVKQYDNQGTAEFQAVGSARPKISTEVFVTLLKSMGATTLSWLPTLEQPRICSRRVEA